MFKAIILTSIVMYWLWTDWGSFFGANCGIIWKFEIFFYDFRPDYTTWNGANPSLLSGRNTSLAKGPNKGLLQSKTYQAKGPNNDLRKGPLFGLAKGSIYSQIKSMLCETRAN